MGVVDPGFEEGDVLLQSHLEEGRVDLILVPEHVVDAAYGELGFLGDLLNRGTVVSFSREDLLRRLQEFPLTSLSFPFLPG